jgi:hypothetical protein
MLSVAERRRSRRLQGAIRARDVRAADLQEEPTKPIESGADSQRHFSSESTKTAAPRRTSQRAIRHSERQRAEQSSM